MYKIFFYHFTVDMKTCKKQQEAQVSEVLEINSKYVLIADIKKENENDVKLECQEFTVNLLNFLNSPHI